MVLASLNDTTVKWNGNVQPCMVTTEEPEQVSEAGLNIKEMTTGAGAEADTLFSDENLPVLQLTAKAEDGERIIRLDISGEDKKMPQELFILQQKKCPCNGDREVCIRQEASE